MTFEQQLTQAFDTLTERLRGEIDREVERRTADLKAAAAARPPDTPAVVEPPAAVEPAAGGASIARLARGFDAVDAASSLTGVLDALLACAVEDAPDASLWLIRGGQPHRWRAAGSTDATDDRATPSLGGGIPLRIAGQTVAVLIAETSNGERRTTNDPLALLARYASRALEALTAFTTARALTEKAHEIADRGLRIAESEAASEEETSARRYARLLVSEIKLYHEPAVIDGRRDRDLVTRLGGEITRARVMYEQRVPPQVRARQDYFQEELVRTLANGDSSLLDVRTEKSEV